VFLTAPFQRRLRLGSRIADSLYWMGRYKARAEQATRMLLVLRRLQIETAGRETADRWAPIWAALARATGHSSEHLALEAEGLEDPSYRLLLAADNSASVARCIASLHDNSRGVRETIPPEVWSAVHRLHQLCEQAQEAMDPSDLARLSDLMQSLLDAVDQLDGAAGKNMLHDDAWHFWRLGQNVERALSTTRITREVLVKHGRAATEHAADLDLDALLRILSCQYAYRSLYQARPTAPNVVALILQDPALPRSVLACLEDIRASLATVSGSSRHAASASPQRSVAKLANAVEFADLGALFTAAEVPVDSAANKIAKPPGPSGPLPLGLWLDELGDRLSELSVEISDHHLHHQAFNILR
jgi:uncharacterized alpha-E superfamily protein